MCDICGCGDVTGTVHHHQKDHNHEQPHTHDHQQPHTHDHEQSGTHDHENTGEAEISVGRDILDINNKIAKRNRGFFKARNIFSVNIMSSPGSGKTTLLEKTLTDLKGKAGFYVIEGDQQTSMDADRIRAVDIPVLQVNTGSGCHLDASMIMRAVREFDPLPGSVVLIENVGNLICPSLFDLGEKARIVLMSTTEGEDKPLKYPDMFRNADLCIINKTDLLKYVSFNVEKAVENALKVNGRLQFLEVSALTGEGMEDWYKWLLANTG
ncbi:MAG: hydrogenase nickel incorporation protein HypB [Bacteroidales bacterium]|nr:hydrogenase nickel incorporation protein HypB [Bacteroidales bacterium]